MKKEVSNLSVEATLKKMGYRNDLMCKEIVSRVNRGNADSTCKPRIDKTRIFSRSRKRGSE